MVEREGLLVLSGRPLSCLVRIAFRRAKFLGALMLTKFPRLKTFPQDRSMRHTDAVLYSTSIWPTPSVRNGRERGQTNNDMDEQQPSRGVPEPKPISLTVEFM